MKLTRRHEHRSMGEVWAASPAMNAVCIMAVAMNGLVGWSLVSCLQHAFAGIAYSGGQPNVSTCHEYLQRMGAREGRVMSGWM